MTTTGERQESGSDPRLGWTKDRITEAKRLWKGGHTASEIAAALGGLTRSAVCGKLFRLGEMRNGASVPTMRKAARPVKAPRKPKAVVEGAPQPKRPAPILVAMTENVCALEDLKPASCRWVVSTEAALFCGEPKDGKRAYCAGHARIAYEPSRAARATPAQLHGLIKFFEGLPVYDPSTAPRTLYGRERRA